MFKVVIAGGDRVKDYAFFEQKCINCLKSKVRDGIMINTTGGEFVECFSKRFNIDLHYFVMKGRRTKDAVNRFHEKVFADADALIAFNDGTKEIKKMIDKAKEKGIPVRDITIEK